MSDILLERRDGPVLVLTLNDPERANPLSAALADRLYRVLAEAAEDRALRAIVLTGAGRHFSAGADLAALERLAEGGTEADNREDAERLERLYAELLDHPKLTVAAVHGAAIGGRGMGDALVSRCGHTAILEIKHGKAEPNELQRKFRDSWQGAYFVVRSPEDAERQLNLWLLTLVGWKK